MKNNLSLISILFLLFFSVTYANGKTNQQLVEDDTVIVKEYSLLADIRGRELTGICVINISQDSSAIGTIINEFGFKAFDFSYINRKVEMFNVMKPLDKWFIRKVLKNDFAFLLPSILFDRKEMCKKKRSMKKLPDGKIIVDNNRHKIKYTFIPLNKVE